MIPLVEVDLSHQMRVVKAKNSINLRVRMDLISFELYDKLTRASLRAFAQMEKERIETLRGFRGNSFRFNIPHQLIEPSICILEEHLLVKNEEGDFYFDDVDVVSREVSFEGSLFDQLTSGSIGPYQFAIDSMQGRRPSMEDAHLACSITLKIHDVSFDVPLFGLFDGHGGKEAALFVSENLAKMLKSMLEEFNQDGLTPLGVWNALKMSCAHLHEQFKVEKEFLHRSGTTATFCLILDGALWVANVGDSRIILQDRVQGTVQLTEDAKPGDVKYLQGIVNRDGSVTRFVYSGGYTVDRINADLAIGRAIGDYHNTPEGFQARGINPRPTITMKPLSEISPGSCLVLACDGVYDVATSCQIGEAISNHCHDLSLEDLAASLVQSCYKSGSTDNITVILVKIPDF
jgi:serine/threonine protein phosphatase PrpC